MTDFVPFVPKHRRLQIIREIQAKMVNVRLLQGRINEATRMRDFYDRMYLLVESGGKVPTMDWATSGIEQSQPKEKPETSDKWEPLDDAWEPGRE